MDKLTPADFNDLWDLANELSAARRFRLMSLLIEFSNLQRNVVAAAEAITVKPQCLCGNWGKPGHPTVGKCSAGIGGV